MNSDFHDPRDIPILTESIEKDVSGAALYDIKSVHAAVVTETLNLADSLLHQAAKSIEAALFERVFDELKAKLPELVDRVLREQAMTNHNSTTNPNSTGATPGQRQEHD